MGDLVMKIEQEETNTEETVNDNAQIEVNKLSDSDLDDILNGKKEIVNNKDEENKDEIKDTDKKDDESKKETPNTSLSDSDYAKLSPEELIEEIKKLKEIGLKEKTN